MKIKNFMLFFIFFWVMIFFAIGFFLYNYEKEFIEKTKINNLDWVIADLKVNIENQKRINENIITEQQLDIKVLKDEIIKLRGHHTRVQKVKITFYAPEIKKINSDSNHRKTATMETPVAGWTIAISRDLVAIGWLGKRIYIRGIGIRMANDIMGKSVNGKIITNQIDVCCGSKDVYKLAKKLGKNTDILATLI